MATVTRDFIVEKLHALVPTIDTSVGSSADQTLIQPIVDLFSGYDVTVFEDFMRTRMEEFDSNVVTMPGSANYDILISALGTLLEPLWWETQTIKQWQSLQNWPSMPYEEMDALVSNLFINRSQGTKSTGSVRLYFGSPTTVFFSQYVRFTTRSGLGFVPYQTSVIQADAMSFNQDGGLYYTDVTVEAEDAGERYNIVSNQIINVENLPTTYSRVTNLLGFTGGTERETNEQLYLRARDSITVRNLVNKKGIRYLLRTEFPTITDIEVIGFGDPEMERDLVQYGYTSTTTVTQIISGGSPITTNTSTVTAGNDIHVGGKADILAWTGDLAEASQDFTNVSSSSPIYLSQSAPYLSHMPITRVKDVERLDPIYLTQTGQYIPYAHPIDCRAYRDFYFGTVGSLDRSLGTVRLFFSRPTMFSVDSNATFTAENGQIFRPMQTQTIAASGMVVNTGQQITKTEMDTNIIYNQNIAYYYFDVSVQSDSAGDESALLSQNDYLTCAGYTSEGWTLSTDDEDLAFSTEEQLALSFTSTFNDGLSVSGESVRVIYEYSPTVEDMQAYCDDSENRVVTTDLLVKHFQPAYVDLAISYEGGMTTDDALVYITNYINGLGPGVYMEVGDIIAMLYSYGATRVVTPIEIFTLILNKDRTYTAVRFEDRYRTDRRIHFVARNIDLEKLA